MSRLQQYHEYTRNLGAKYEPGDIATFYFIVKDEDEKDLKIIKAWTDDKKLAKFYMEFHNTPRYRMKKVTKSIEEIREITEENYHDEIVIANVYTRNSKNKKRSDEVTTVVIPATQTELNFINEESESFFSFTIDYHYINSAIPFLKNRYQKALWNIFLGSVMKKVIENKTDKYNSQIELDQLKMLIKCFPNDFA